MKTTLALIAAATLTLGLTACSGDPEPAKTVTKTAASEPATEEDVQAEKEAATGEDMWAALDTYDDAHSLGQAIGDDFWATGDNAFECTKAEQGTIQERDESTGEVADVTYLECSRKGTMELVNLAVNGDYKENGPAVPICDELLEGDTCFTGKGWTIDAANTHLLKEALEALDIDPKDWAVGEDVTDGY